MKIIHFQEDDHIQLEIAGKLVNIVVSDLDDEMEFHVGLWEATQRGIYHPGAAILAEFNYTEVKS